MQTATFQTAPFNCPSCIKKIENALGKQTGVEKVQVLFHSGKVRVEFKSSAVSPDLLESTITKLGYPVLSKKIS